MWVFSFIKSFGCGITSLPFNFILQRTHVLPIIATEHSLAYAASFLCVHEFHQKLLRLLFTHTRSVLYRLLANTSQKNPLSRPLPPPPSLFPPSLSPPLFLLHPPPMPMETLSARSDSAFFRPRPGRSPVHPGENNGSR